MKHYLLDKTFNIAVMGILILSLASSTHLEATTAQRLEATVEIPSIAETVTETMIEPEPMAEASPRLTSFTIIENPHRDLLEENPDYLGWITINGTQVNDPIVKSKDNLDYLYTDFWGNESKAGSLFMDYRNFGFGFSQNTIIYGHNMKDGTMFGTLKKYLDRDFAMAHPTIAISDLYGTREFRIYASYYASADGDLIRTHFEQGQFQPYVNEQMARSAVDYGFTPPEGSPILTLVTCNYAVNDGRFFIHGVEIMDRDASNQTVQYDF